MSEWLKKLLPLAYLGMLLIAIYVVYASFGSGLKRGEFTGKYYPPDTLKPGAALKPKEEVFLVDLLEPTPEMLSAGKQLFLQNCVSCHGSEGKGNGPKAAGLNPPPRNFTAEQFKNGAASLQIFNTLGTGIPGSSMASFSFLSVRERMDLAHYVRTFVPNPPPNPHELVDQLPKPSGAGAATAAAPSAANADSAKKSEKIKPLPLELAESQILKEAAEMAEKESRVEARTIESQLWVEHCSVCHGESGQGRVYALRVPNTGLIYARTKPLSEYHGPALESPETLAHFLAAGIPGLPGHRFSALGQTAAAELLDGIRQSQTH